METRLHCEKPLSDDVVGRCSVFVTQLRYLEVSIWNIKLVIDFTTSRG